MSNLSLLYLSRQDVEKVALDIPTIIDLLEKAFREKGEGKVELPPKPGIHTPLFMPCQPISLPFIRQASNGLAVTRIIPKEGCLTFPVC